MTLLQAIDLAKTAVQDYENSFEIFKRKDNHTYFFAILGTVRNSSIFQYIGYVSIAGVFIKRSY